MIQWKQLAGEDPRLLKKNPAKGSIAHRFQQARWNFIVGILFGVIVCGVFIASYIWMFS